jgi:3-oxoacyl-(acyl-carrier-protein) synthase
MATSEHGVISLTSAEFREHFFKQYNDIPRKERKERLKKFGHLNLKSSEEAVNDAGGAMDKDVNEVQPKESCD